MFRKPGRKSTLLIVLATALVLAWCLPALATDTGEPPAPGEKMPVFTGPMPPKKPDRDYLGLKGPGKEFVLADIKAPVVMIEYFSLYCSHCKAEAPHVDEVFADLKKKGYYDKIKWLAFGSNNNQMEADAFRMQYKVPFPMLPDKELKVFRAASVHWTPYFIAVQNTGPKAGTVLFNAEGKLPSAAELLKVLEKNGATY
ncbi:MAG: TlpA family protein disulfide reductase [Deltaproteobacteria bacterium]|nr:TlpA family protein disulfide reductase [Deltaproteobacteria bacterium]